MVHRNRSEDAVYRCPKGGFHKLGRRGFMQVFFGFTLSREATVRYRRCRKCGRTFGAGGMIKT